MTPPHGLDLERGQPLLGAEIDATTDGEAPPLGLDESCCFVCYTGAVNKNGTSVITFYNYSKDFNDNDIYKPTTVWYPCQLCDGQRIFSLDEHYCPVCYTVVKKRVYNYVHNYNYGLFYIYKLTSHWSLARSMLRQTEEHIHWAWIQVLLPRLLHWFCEQEWV